MPSLPKILETSTRLVRIETTTVLDPDLVSEFKIPFGMEGTIYYWLWDDETFMLWDNDDRIRR
jgi:hypothetical protein